MDMAVMQKIVDSLSVKELLAVKEKIEERLVRNIDFKEFMEQIIEQRFAEGLVCPRCGGKHIKKFGFDGRRNQRYSCKNSGTFIPTTKTVFGCSTENHKERQGVYPVSQKDLCDHRDGLRLICVSLERRTVPAVASAVCLMQKNELPDSAVVAFLKNTGDKKKNVHKLLKFLRKAKKTFRVVVLDVTNVGWDERCDFTIENCDLTQRMFKNLRSILIRGRKRWKVLSADKEMLKGALLDKEHVGESERERIECTCCRECGVKAFVPFRCAFDLIAAFPDNIPENSLHPCWRADIQARP